MSVFLDVIICGSEGCNNTFPENGYNNPKVYCRKCERDRRNSRALTGYYRKKEAKKIAWIPLHLQKLIPNLEKI